MASLFFSVLHAFDRSIRPVENALTLIGEWQFEIDQAGDGAGRARAEAVLLMFAP